MTSSEMRFTVQPLWVQTAVNALKVPSAGWVTTTFVPETMATLPPLRGTSDVLVMTPVGLPLPAPVGDPPGSVAEGDPPQAARGTASAPAEAVTAAPRNT